MAVPPDRLRPALLRLASRRRTTSPLIAQARHAREPACRSCTSSTASAPRTRSRRSRCSTTTTSRALIDDDAGRRPPRPGADARPPGPPRHAPRTPTPSSRPARPATRFYDSAARRSSRRRWTSSPAHRPAVPPVRLLRRTPRPSACIVADGLRRARRPTRRWTASSAQRREGRRRSRSGSTGRSRSRTSSPRCRDTVTGHRRARPHQGAGRRRRAALPGRRDGAPRGASRRTSRSRCTSRASSAAATACRPRSSRRRWSRPSSTSWRRTAPKNHFTVGIVDDVTHTLARRTTPDFDIEPDDVVRARVLRPGGRRHGRREQELDQDHRRGDRPTTPRATSSTTRRSRARSPSRTCASARGRSAPRYLIRTANFVACHQFAFLEKFDVLEIAAPGRDVPAQRPVRAGRGLGPPAARGAGADHREAAQVLRDRRLQGGPRDRHGRAHQHHHADLLLRPLRRAAARGGDRPDQEGDREDLRQARARRWCSRTSPRSTTRWRTCTR